MRRDWLAAGIGVVALAALSLERWGNAPEQAGVFLPLVRSLAGDWPAPVDDHLALLKRLPLLWCRILAPFEARGRLFEALFGSLVLGRIALAAAGMALGAVLAPRGASRFAAAGIFVLAAPSALLVTNNPFIDHTGMPTGLALPMTLGAIALAAAARPVAGGVLLGVAANIHPGVPFALLPGFAAAALVASERKSLLLALGAAGLLASPVILWTLAHAVSDAALPMSEVLPILRRIPGHFYLSVWGREGCASALALAALLASRARGRRSTPGRAVALAGAVGLATAAVGVGLTELDLLPYALLKMVPSRAFLAAKGASLALAGTLLPVELRRGKLPAAASSLIVAGLLEAEPLVPAGVAALALLELIRGKASPGRLALSATALALALASLAAAPIAVPGRSLVLAALVFASGAVARRRPRLALALCLAASVLVHHVKVLTVGGYGVAVEEARTTVFPADAFALRAEAGRFVERATPADALLLVSPEDDLFSYLSGRNVVATSYQASFAVWDVKGGLEDLARLERIRDARDPRGYHAWRGARVLEAARAVKATHILIDRGLGEPDLGEPLFENARFRVYAVH